MLGLVWSEGGGELFVPGIAFGCEPLQRLRHGHDVVKDQQVGNQMVVFDELALLISDGLVRQCAASEGDPLGKLVEAFALVRRGLDEPSQLDIAQVVEQKTCSDDVAQLSKRKVEFALSRVRSQPS